MLLEETCGLAFWGAFVNGMVEYDGNRFGES